MGESGPERIADRRARERARVVGTAIVLTSDRYVGTFLVENVSAAGALLAGDSQLSIGDPVRVLLQMHGFPRVGVRGKVIRRAERDGQKLFAITFQAGPAAHGVLQKSVWRMVEASSPLTLIVDENTESCAALTCELGLLSRNAVAVHTPLDAISWLHADGVCVESIAVGTKFADMDGLDLLEFVALDFPTVRRVLIVQGDQDLQRTADAAHAVLKEPWGREALERAFPAEAP